MSSARRHAAARNSLAAIIALAIPLASASAENGPELLLPLVTAIALASATQGGVTSSSATMTLSAAPAPHGSLSVLPSQLRIPDGYAEDVDIPLPRYAEPLDSDRIVSFDLFRRAKRGWMASLAYDQESRCPLPGSNTVLSLVAEFQF